MKSFLAPAGYALVVILCLPLSVEAHRAWMLPSATVLSGANLWVTVDAAISNDLFYFEHNPIRLDNLAITAPDGSPVKAENASHGEVPQHLRRAAGTAGHVQDRRGQRHDRRHVRGRRRDQALARRGRGLRQGSAGRGEEPPGVEDA